MDKNSKTDAYCILFQFKGKGDRMKEKIGMTEVINDNINPEFVKTLEADFYFEE